MTSCPSAPLAGFVHSVNSVLIDGVSGLPFQFETSFNVPDLTRLELVDGKVREPTAFEIADLLCSARQVGATIVRTYVLSHGVGTDFHIMSSPSGPVLNERWFRVLDLALEMAHTLGVRMIIPFVNSFHYAAWGSSAMYGVWTRESSSQFFYSGAQRVMFKQVLQAVLLRNNTITGRRYADEPAIFAWELGNELMDVQEKPPAIEWTEDVAFFVKSIDRKVV